MSSIPHIAFGLVATTAAALAQQPAFHSPQDMETSFAGDAVAIASRSTMLQEFGDRLVGGGPGYSVVLGRDGVEYTPALGRRAPRAMPVRFTLQSIRRTDVDWLAVDGPLPRPRAEDGTAVFGYGAGIDERFEMRSDGVALSYHFARPLGGSGDLVVRLALDTELETEHRGALPADGLVLSAPGLGGVRIGGVTGIDGAGRSVPGGARFDGRHLELVLPEAFVDSAAYPLVLDPLIGTDFLAEASGFDDINADVAYDADNDVYLVVWQVELSATNVHAHAQRISGGGTLLGGFLLPSGFPFPSVTLNCKVGNVRFTNKFLVAWQEGASILGPWDIRCSTVDAATGAVSPTATIAATAADEVDPDVASDGSGVDDEALVVWQRVGGGIFGAQVNAPVAGAPIAFASVPILGGVTHSKPAIAKNGGSQGRYLVAWESSGQFINAALVDRNMTVLDNTHTVAAAPGAGEPDVDGNGSSSWSVVWHQLEGAAASARDIYCRVVRWNGANLSNVSAITGIATDAGQDERSPAVGFLFHKYLVAWADEQVGSGPFAYDIVARGFDTAACIACGPEYCVGCTGLIYDFDPEIGTQISGGATPTTGGTGDRAFVSFSSAVNIPPFNSEVRGQLYEAVGSSGGFASLGGGCGSAGSPGVGGPLAIGNKLFSFTVSGADPAATLAVLVLNGAVAPIPCGPCLLTPPAATLSTPMAGGFASQSVPIPCATNLVGGTVQFQWWVVGTAASPCALLPNVSITGRVNATVGL